MERQLRSVESERRAIEREYLYWLTKTPSLGAVKIRKMWERFQSFECIYNIEEKLLRSGGRSYTIIITVTDINRVAQEKLFVNAFLFAAEKKHPMYYSVKICYTDSRKVDLFGTFAPGF